MVEELGEDAEYEAGHRSLAVWQHGMELARLLYKATENFPRNEEFGLKSQLRRAGVSLPSNIAEGAARETDRDYLRFLFMARGSSAEIETQLELAHDFGYLSREALGEIWPVYQEFGKSLSGLIRKIKADNENA